MPQSTAMSLSNLSCLLAKWQQQSWQIEQTRGSFREKFLFPENGSSQDDGLGKCRGDDSRASLFVFCVLACSTH
eukprot:3890144-Amphidinium_carterae.1